MHYYTAPGIKNINICPAEMTEEMKLQTAKSIIETVARFYGVPLDKVMKKGRSGDTPRVRQLSTWIIKDKVRGLSLKQVSELYGVAYLQRNGNHDHSAIIHNIQKVNGYIKVKDPISEDIHTLMQII